MGKITFFEEKNFQGRSYETGGDCADLLSFFTRCNSARVESGCWVLYEKPSYKGYQYILSPGDYTDYQQWKGFSDTVRSCRHIKNVYGNVWRLKLYERPDFGGQIVECTEDCPSLPEAYKLGEVFSCVVLQGAWVLYELPGYRGRQYFMEPGDYRKYSDWGAPNPALGSLHRITKF